ncbi:MAG: S1C family serine protease [Halodesulfurarchaeum sp.]
MVRRLFLPAVFLALAFGLIIGGGIGLSLAPADGGGQASISPPGSNPQLVSPTEARSNYTRLYRETIDSVVKIRVRTPIGVAQGSGFIYEGRYIVTNQHVVEGATDIAVQFSDGVWRTARVVGTDVYTDLAVIRVPSIPDQAEALPVATTDPEPGQRVVALGSPFGLEGTITHGIVSGVNRSMRVEGGFSIPDTVQTDAPINPGNSGGPLVSMQGTVVGVNRAKEGDNVGFAISADVVRTVVPKLIRTGEFEHSYIGIRTIPVTPPVADSLDLQRARGILVVQVLEGTPAAGVFQAATVKTTAAGVTATGGDVIVAIEGHPIRSNQELSQYLLFHTSPGETVTMTVLRDGGRRTLQLTLGSRPEP